MDRVSERPRKRKYTYISARMIFKAIEDMRQTLAGQPAQKVSVA